MKKPSELREYALFPEAEHAEKEMERIDRLIEEHRTLFSCPPGKELFLFSSPGRTELGGNHTDHNYGRVLAAAVHLDTIAVVTPRDDSTVVMLSEGYPPVTADISSTQPVQEELGKTEALVRGIADYFKKKGITINGFQAHTSSRILKGSGLSSSAAIEVLIGTIWNELNGTGCLSPVDIALAGQYAENTYFGKPCGLMDQLASSCGGVIAIDFQDPSHPLINTLTIDFHQMGYTLCVVDTGGNHADLTADYAAVFQEMKLVAELFGQSALRGLTVKDLSSRANEIRSAAGDRAWLRALHFVLDDHRVCEQERALKKGDIIRYLQLVNDSGASSSNLLQNSYSLNQPGVQGIPIGLALTQLFLESHNVQGAARVHGGGFAGTIQAYIPASLLAQYIPWMEAVFGKDAVTPLTIRNRPAGLISRGTLP